jgi:hypothetical protein
MQAAAGPIGRLLDAVARKGSCIFTPAEFLQNRNGGGMEEGGHRVCRAEFEANLAAKLADRTFTRDIEPLLAPRAAWDIEDAARYAREELRARLPGEPWKGGEAEP